MTVRKLYERYIELMKHYETICIAQVVNDLRQCLRPQKEKPRDRKERDEEEYC